MVASIASGESAPSRNTDSPSRVTNRSSCTVLRRWWTMRATLRRTELEPISTAARTLKSARLPLGGLHREIQTASCSDRLALSERATEYLHSAEGHAVSLRGSFFLSVVTVW